MIPATGVRIGWADLPDTVRAGVEAILGDSVTRTLTQAGGFSPGSADRVVTSHGRRAFVKAVGAGLNTGSVRLHRREADVAARLSPDVPAPTVLGSYDDGEWIALVFDDIDGRHPVTPWIRDEIDSAMSALQCVAAVKRVEAAGQVPAVLPLRDVLGDDLSGWQRISDDPPADLDPWARQHLGELCARARARAAGRAPHGDSLVHCDVRADNLLVRADGTVVVVDWPNAAFGPAWLDRLLLLINVNYFGGHSMDELAARLDVDDGVLSDALAGLTGYFLDVARRPPPPGLPTVRRFQSAQGRRSLDWLKDRIGRDPHATTDSGSPTAMGRA